MTSARRVAACAGGARDGTATPPDATRPRGPPHAAGGRDVSRRCVRALASMPARAGHRSHRRSGVAARFGWCTRRRLGARSVRRRQRSFETECFPVSKTRLPFRSSWRSCWASWWQHHGPAPPAEPGSGLGEAAGNPSNNGPDRRTPSASWSATRASAGARQRFGHRRGSSPTTSTPCCLARGDPPAPAGEYPNDMRWWIRQPLPFHGKATPAGREATSREAFAGRRRSSGGCTTSSRTSRTSSAPTSSATRSR